MRLVIIESSKKLLHMSAKEQHTSLAKIFNKADTNGDGMVEYEEIHQWMHKLEQHIVKRDVAISVIWFLSFTVITTF